MLAKKNIYSSAEVATALGALCPSDFGIKGVTIDSRKVAGHDLFIAIKGERFDGAKFAADAVESGASGVVVTGWVSGVVQEKQIVVKDTFVALNQLAKFARERSSAKFVGVTGSVGKTSAKQAIAMALNPFGETFASAGNLNNHYGVPLNLCNLPLDARYAVIEMGMNHAGEIKELTALARPHVAVITNVEAVHLEFFKSVQGIADAKAEIFLGVEPGGVAVLNRDNQYFDYLSSLAAQAGIKNIVSFGFGNMADCSMLEWRTENGMSVIRASIGGKKIDYRILAGSRHQALNSVAALAVVHALGLDPEKTIKNLAAFSEEEGRGASVELKVEGIRFTLIDDSYNASPVSMMAAIEKLRHYTPAVRKIAVLGDMLELGDESPKLHAGLAENIDAAGVSMLITCGDLMKNLHDSVKAKMRRIHFNKPEEALECLVAEVNQGDVVLLKGSHGSGMYKIAESLKQRSQLNKSHSRREKIAV